MPPRTEVAISSRCSASRRHRKRYQQNETPSFPEGAEPDRFCPGGLAGTQGEDSARRLAALHFPQPAGSLAEMASYLILDSLNATCLRATRSYFISSSFSVFAPR